jgi:hypothetical protein
MGNSPKLVAVPTSNVDDQSLGAITMWSMSGPTDVRTLQAAWAARGLDDGLLPALPSPTAALALAVRDVCEGRHFPRRLPGGGGWVVVEEKGQRSDVSWHADAVVTLDVVGRPEISPPGHPIADALQAAFDARVSTLTTSVMGGWMAGVLGSECAAQAVRPNGGVYFVPAHSMPLWRTMAAAIHEATDHQVTFVPAMRCEDAIESVLAALTAETEAEAASLSADVCSGDLGARALRTRSAKANALADKLEIYEGVLDRSLAGLRTQLDNISGAAVQAALVLEAE